MANWTFTKLVTLMPLSVQVVYTCASDDATPRIVTQNRGFDPWVDTSNVQHPTDQDIDDEGYNVCNAMTAQDVKASGAVTAFAALATTSGPPTTTPAPVGFTPEQQAVSDAAVASSQANNAFGAATNALSQLQILVTAGAITSDYPDYQAAVQAAGQQSPRFPRLKRRWSPRKRR